MSELLTEIRALYPEPGLAERVVAAAVQLREFTAQGGEWSPAPMVDEAVHRMTGFRHTPGAGHPGGTAETVAAMEAAGYVVDRPVWWIGGAHDADPASAYRYEHYDPCQVARSPILEA